MDNSGFKIAKEHGHYVLYQNGIFKCSGDTKREVEEEQQKLSGN